MGVLAGISAGTGGFQAGKNNSKLRKSICDTNQQISKISNDYNRLLKAEDTEIKELNSQFVEGLKTLERQRVELFNAKSEWNKTKKNLELTSILFIFAILISLIFKYVDFYTMIYNAI